MLRYCSFCCAQCCLTDKINFTLVNCKCGQQPNMQLMCKWDEPSMRGVILRGWENTEVYFEPLARDTILPRVENTQLFFDPARETSVAMVRGNTPMVKNHLYYFEIKVLAFYDEIMFGVGLEDITSYMGPIHWNEYSWQYLSRGLLMHHYNKVYGRCKFGFGSIVGMYVNMIDGTLEYFLNRQSLGKAFDGLNDYTLYPFVSAYSSNLVRLTAAVEIEPTLQFLCREVIRRHERLIKQLSVILKLYKMMSYWDLPPYQEADGKILSVKDLFTLARRRFDYVEVFGNTYTCNCPKAIKQMLISDTTNRNSSRYWNLVTTDATQDYWLHNEYLIKSAGCAYRNLSKLCKFTKLTYAVSNNKISIIFDTNSSTTNDFLLLKHCDKEEFYPYESRIILIAHSIYNGCDRYIKVLLDTCQCELNGSCNNPYDNIDFILADLLCNGNGTYTIGLSLVEKRTINKNDSIVNLNKSANLIFNENPSQNIKRKCSIC